MTKPKADLPKRPLSAGVCELDPDQLLTRYQVLGVIGCSETTLDDWHNRKKPPPRREYNGLPRYRAGDICAFVRGDPPALLEMKGGRRPKVAHASFAEFAAHAGVRDTWPFLMVGDPNGPTMPPRPVDLLETLTMDGITDGDSLEWLTLLDYASSLLRHQQAVALAASARGMEGDGDEATRSASQSPRGRRT